MTWNEHIGRMTVEEKRRLLTEHLTGCVYAKFEVEIPLGTCSMLSCKECWADFLNSAYTKGETK